MLPEMVPQNLLAKINSVVAMASASGGSQYSVFVVNLNRVDPPASAIDQQPYIAVFDHSASAASGGFLHHGTWPGRTDLPGQYFFDAIAASGITAYVPMGQMPAAPSGLLSDLSQSSQGAAFNAALMGLQNSRA
jgi:hypothetical protein